MGQQKNKFNIAILAPDENAYSETFIRAHKDYIDGNIRYYYGGLIPKFLEGYGRLNGRINLKIFLRNFVDLIKNRSNENVFNNLCALEESLVKNKIDVVLSEYGYTAAESLPAIRRAKIPLVVHFHGMDAHSNEIFESYKERYKEIFSYASRIIVVSNDMKKRLISIGCPEEKIVYTVCAPNDEFFDVLPTFQTKQFLAMGRFVDKKAPYYTILAFGKLLGKNPEAKLKMAADGPLLNVCKNIVRNLGIESNVEFVGVIGRERIKKEMKQSLAFVQHSVTAQNGDSEGTPVAVMESCAAGLPVIATRHAGIKDVVIDGETGILVEEHDVDKMSEAMERLLDNPRLAKKMGDSGKERMKKLFSMDKHIASLNRALKESVADSK